MKQDKYLKWGTVDQTRPDSDTFKSDVKAELGITAKNENKFDFNDSYVIPRILIGLKSGELLAEKLNVNQLLEQELDLAFFSPNLTAWKTALNSKNIITG